MNTRKVSLSMLAIFLLIMSSFGAIGTVTLSESDHQNYDSHHSMFDASDVHSAMTAEMPSAVAVSDANPFFSLIATPLTVHYDEYGEQEIIPLYVKNFDDPSSAIERAEEQIGIPADYLISDIYTAKEISLVNNERGIRKIRGIPIAPQ